MDGAAQSTAWSTEVLIRFSHCDPAGIVYFATAFDILNGVVEDWFTDCLRLPYNDIVMKRRIGLGYGRAACDYRKPAEMGDRLACSVRIERLGTKSVTLAISAMRGADEIFEGSLVIVATDLDRRVSIVIPDDIRAALAAYLEKTA